RAIPFLTGVFILGCGGACGADQDSPASAPPRAETPAPQTAEASPQTAEPAANPTEGEKPVGETPPADEAEETSEARPAPRLDRSTQFLGASEHRQRLALATQPIADIEKGRGGRSLAFKITLEDGTVGYYKPEQSFSAAHWYAEVASYYLDRELGIGRVPPTVGRRLPWAPLRAIAGNDRRVPEIVVQEDGTVRGAFIWWVPGGLDAIDPPEGWERWVRLDGSLSIDPYQRPREWSRDQRRFRAGTLDPPAAEAGDPDTPERAGELSDLILFDYLTTNVDRWGGSFTNVRTRGEGGPLVYLDNGAGFTPGPVARIPLMDARLHGLQRFRRPTLERIRQLDFDRLRRRMAQDPLAPILNERQWTHLSERRAHLLEYADGLAASRGADVFLE
ncbi:MAG: hypothetical protein AAGF12_26055, partial [Myxococcota bacterium]